MIKLVISFFFELFHPGLGGFSASSLRNMRMFYEEWHFLDSNSPNAFGELQKSDYERYSNFTNAFSEFKEIDIYQSFTIPESLDFPVEDFFRVPFSHHIAILFSTTQKESRYYLEQKGTTGKGTYYSVKGLSMGS